MASGRKALVLSQADWVAWVSGWQKEAKFIFLSKWEEKDTAVTESITHSL